eukprot:2156241-Prorocentrum_lima.AAC.1
MSKKCVLYAYEGELTIVFSSMALLEEICTNKGDPLRGKQGTIVRALNALQTEEKHSLMRLGS